MATKRLRIFAGPNGSGKTTFVKNIVNNPPSARFSLGYFVNADEIELSLRENGSLDFSLFGIKISSKDIQSHFKRSKFAPEKLNLPSLWENFIVIENHLVISKKVQLNSYIAADIAEFIRRFLLKHQISFSYETVMSDKAKIVFLKKAKKEGYRIYLYFFATEDPLINLNRVKIRVKQHGHSVKKADVERRYYKSLDNLRAAIELSDRAYLFDNSTIASVLIAEINDGTQVNLFDPTELPNWFARYVL